MEMRKLRDRATEAFAKGRFSKAAEFYEEYCKAEPKDYQARLRTGDAWAKAGQKDRAISAYQLAATGFAREGFLPRAIAASKLILELDPAHKGVQQMLADLYARKSAGGTGVPQRPSGPPRRVELPTFTEHMGVSMGPSVAPLELPEEDEEAAPAQQASIPPAPVVDRRGFTRGGPQEPELPVHEPLEISDTPPAPRAAPVQPVQQVDIPLHEPLELLDARPATRTTPVQPVQQADIPLHEPLEISDAPPAPKATPVQRADIPLHEPLEIPDAPPATQTPPVQEMLEDDLMVVRGVPVSPVPVPPSAQPPAPRAQPQPQAPTAPSASSAPPGLAPRAAAPRTPAAAPPSNTVASPDETALEVDLGKGTKKLAWAAISEPLFPAVPPAGGSSAPTAAAPTPAAPTPAAPASTPASAAPPGLRPRRSGEASGPDMALTPAPGYSAVVAPPRPASLPATAFTELELEPDDTLLHAVEEAALSGMKQRAASAPGAAPPQEEEEVIILTEEAAPGAPSVDALPNIPLFSDLPREAFIELFERCPLRRFAQGERVFEQGSHGDAFYVICEGGVRVFRQEGGQRKDLATLGSGAFFGEMALLSGASRMASVESATEDTQLLEISAPVLAELSRQHPQVARALKKFCRERLLSNVMGTSALFEPFNRKDRRALVEKFRAREVKKNEIIVREGENTDGLYVVLSGEVEARKGEQVLARLKEGELFGEISLLSKTPATATVAATRRTSLLRLPREDFDALILSHPQILVLVSELSEQRLRRTEALTGEQVIELTADELLV